MAIYADIQRLEPGEFVDLFELDATSIGGDVRRFHGYTQVGPIIWQGQSYEPWALQAEGFSRVSDGQQPAPTLTVGDPGGIISALCRVTQDLIGAEVRRRRTLGRYLDAANFGGSNPTADPNEELPIERWTVEQRVREVPGQSIEFELASALSFDGIQLPRRQIVPNMCQWLVIGGYRGPYCNYSGGNYFDANDQPVGDPALDRCGGRVSSCKARFGEYEVLNFGGMPSADGLRG